MAQVQIEVKSKRVEVNGRKFITYYTQQFLRVKGEEEKGLQPKYVNLKFRRDVDTSKIRNGVLTCNEEDVSAPLYYDIVEKDGKKQYPTVWVKGIVEFTPFKAKPQFLLNEKATKELETK